MKAFKKILLFPLRILTLILKLAVNILIKVESYALAVIMLPLIICIITCVVGKMWIQLKVFGLIGAAIFVIVFISVALEVWIDIII